MIFMGNFLPVKIVNKISLLLLKLTEKILLICVHYFLYIRKKVRCF